MSYITENDIIDESQECFLTYAEEVLTDRAIPAAEDGLLSAQRKILWTMLDPLKMTPNGKTKKCNAIIGTTLATSYFHGDQACYGVLCKMSQPYLMRYPLIQGQGSLGTQEDNSMVASSRYTEAKPSVYAELMMKDYKKNIVPTKETYNGEYMEPVYLPSLFPNALCNGRQAIGISMSHNSPCHNLSEVCDAIVAYIKKGDLTIDELMQYIKGPDFPLPNTIINTKDIREALRTGRSSTSLKIRGEYELEGDKIIFTSIPYRTYRNKIKEQLEKNADEFEKVIDDFDDESSKGDNKLVFTIKKGISAQAVLDKLFALTDLQTTLSYNMNFIVNGTPKVCSILDLIKAYYSHQTNCIINAAKYDKEKAEKRKHILEGLIIVAKDIDNAIIIIKSSNTPADAIISLTKKYSISTQQAEAVLDMKLARLTKLNRDDLLKELEEKINLLQILDKTIEDKNYRDTQVLIPAIQKMKKEYGDERRTKLINLEIATTKEAVPKEIKNVEPEKCVIVTTEDGMIKRIPISAFKIQKKNGIGIKTQSDIINSTIRTNTIDSLLVFSDKGKVYRMIVNEVPEGTNSSKGFPIKSLLPMEPNEKPILTYSIYRDTDAQYIVFVTKNGIIKKSALSEYTSIRKKGGISAIKLREGDSIASVSLIKDENLILLTYNGQSLHFKSTEVTSTGRDTFGVKGITLAKDDYVVSMCAVRVPTDDLAIILEDGRGKRVKLKEFVVQGRGGKGAKATAEGKITSAALVEDSDNILIVGANNAICIAAKDIPILNKIADGNQLIRGTKVTSVTKV